MILPGLTIDDRRNFLLNNTMTYYEQFTFDNIEKLLSEIYKVNVKLERKYVILC